MRRKAGERQCLACRTHRDQKEFIRIVRSREGFFLDPGPKVHGRSAYLCRDKDCIGRALSRRSLTRAFGAAVPKEILERLEKEGEGNE